MPNGILLALQAISSLLSVAGEISLAVMKYKALIDQATAEGRDISPAELAQLKADNDALEAVVKAKLQAAINRVAG